MKYYYIVIDTLEKTLEIFPASTCQATTERAIASAKFDIENLNCNIRMRIKQRRNGIKPKINT